MSSVVHARHHLLLRCLVTAQFVGNQNSGNVRAALEEFAKEFLGGGLVSPALHEDIKNVPILVDGPPEIVLRAVDRNEALVQMPLTAYPESVAVW